jgi:hypothetical protein
MSFVADRTDSLAGRGVRPHDRPTLEAVRPKEPISTHCRQVQREPAVKSGRATLFVDGKKVGEGAVPMAQAMVFSADDGCDVGEDSRAPPFPPSQRVRAGSTDCGAFMRIVVVSRSISNGPT